MDETPSLNEASLQDFLRRVPRYTSYPTAPFFTSILSDTYQQILSCVNGPFSLYIHIPFCRKMCLFCACSVIINRKEETQNLYVDSLIQEIQQVGKALSGNKTVRELHFGGGTPTNLHPEQFERIFSALENEFTFTKDAECSIEIDPRTVVEKTHLPYIRTRFQRVSLGVQDTNASVQEAVRRRQTKEVTAKVVQEARNLQFSGINIDLIYGLPLQTKKSFKKTVEEIIEMRPDRIALFSYAKVPFLKPHQKAIRNQDLPKDQEKFQMYLQARKQFIQAGYIPIGMDHFAQPKDPLVKAYQKGLLYRNFQGYGIHQADHMLGFGVSAIGFALGTYIQNTKDLTSYHEAVKKGVFPVERGKKQTPDDRKRYQVIQKIMCQFSYSFTQQEMELFSAEIAALKKEKRLVVFSGNTLQVTPLGRVFIRNVASTFDAYLEENPSSYAGSV